MNNIEQLREMLISSDSEIILLALSILRPALECCKRTFALYGKDNDLLLLESDAGYSLLEWIEWYKQTLLEYPATGRNCKAIIDTCLEVYKEITE